MPIGEIIGVISEVGKETSQELAKETKKLLGNLDQPLNVHELRETSIAKDDVSSWLRELDEPLNSDSKIENESVSFDRNDGFAKGNLTMEANDVNPDVSRKPEERLTNEEKHRYDVENFGKMEPPINIRFTCPEGMDKNEFVRQLKGQERGLNRQTVAENMDNRMAFEQRKIETGNGRDLFEGKKSQEIAREKETQRRIETNQKHGMSYGEAKSEAEEWIKSRAALHNPDQIVGGDPGKVLHMGDAGVNSSIGSQWKTRVGQLSQEVENYAKDRTRDELEHTKMNVKLVVA